MATSPWFTRKGVAGDIADAREAPVVCFADRLGASVAPAHVQRIQQAPGTSTGARRRPTRRVFGQADPGLGYGARCAVVARRRWPYRAEDLAGLAVGRKG